MSIFKDDRLVAVSYFDVTYLAQYSTLAFYEPTESRRSLGILTMMLEILHGLKNKKNFHYPGHAYYEQSIYEYKKQFHNTEYYNWEVEDWHLLNRKK
ncbi:MAG: hypothetical protein HC817_16530 [Saprospiraceae bacterium]|nr:hypothetical protein [Saprospiraceae bacterium]